MLPFDLTEIVESSLTADRRDPDGLLHASGHMIGSLRHAQLDVAGAPKITSAVVRDIRMFTGTMWHEWLGKQLQREGIPMMREVNLTPWLPKGWGGTCDFLIFNPEYNAFALIDLKTAKGDSIRWRLRDGASEEHIYQTSLYWHGAKKMGIPLMKRIGVYYLPMDAARGNADDAPAAPLLVEFDPLPWTQLEPIVTGRHESVRAYLESLPEGLDPEAADPKLWITDALAPVQNRVARPVYTKRTGVWEAKLMPHWSTQFCDYDNELCNCREQGVTKIGEWDEDGEYHARNGYEMYLPPKPPAFGRS